MPYKKSYNKPSWKKPNFSKHDVAPKSTSWEKSSRSYNELVGASGHYFHEHVIIPKSLALLKLKKGDSILEFGCGQGVLARKLQPGVMYVGIDASESLINQAKKYNKNPIYHFEVDDVTTTLKTTKKDFNAVTIILALQNFEFPAKAITNAAKHLKPGGKLLIVLNHPAFRIPRQSGWGVNEQNKMQYRWVSQYMSALKIPIKMHPGQQHSSLTWSFHQPLSAYSQYLADAGFLIEKIDEWISDKNSTGPMAKSEDRARAEIPLFMAILAVKTSLQV